ncbi:MAG: electron transfer flavoprotein subunit beta/FixA family protein [Chloroflexi bacterium]|nr:electron transfer flavoprotein subunit beta/FixA family protein [Chloroflexota bacterium]
MKIVVCVKQVVDTTPPVELDFRTSRLPGNLNYIVNPADENATEEALRLKERHGGEVILISAGPPRITRALRACLAMGADRAIHIWHPALEEGDGLVTAQLLARAIAPLSPDLVLCGNRSLDEGTGQVPPALAEFLGLPQITGVTLLEVSPAEARIMAHRKLEKGCRQVVKSGLPALVSVDTSINRCRYPAFRSVRWARKEPITTLDYEALGIEPPDCPTHLVKLAPPRPRPKKTLTMDSSLSPEERVRQLMSGGLAEKKTTLWEGTPEDLATRLARVLTQEHFFPPNADNPGRDGH